MSGGYQGANDEPLPISLDLDSPELASSYERLGLRQFNHGKVLLKSLSLKPGERVLDVGCGTGLLGAYAAEQMLEHSVLDVFRSISVDRPTFPLPARSAALGH